MLHFQCEKCAKGQNLTVHFDYLCTAVVDAAIQGGKWNWSGMR